MKFPSWIKLLIVIAFLTTAIYPQTITDGLRLGYTGIGSSARALGMGNSYIGLSDDASAGFFNPAGFGLLKKMEFSGGLDYSNFSNNATLNSNGSNIGQSSKNSASSTTLDRVSFAFPFPTVRGSLVFGLSYQNTKDFNNALSFNGINPGSSFISFLAANQPDLTAKLHLSSPVYINNQYSSEFTPLSGALNQSGNILNSGGINNWTFSGAIEIYKNLFVGLNLNMLSGTYESNSDYFEDATANSFKGVVDSTDLASVNFQTFYLNKLLKWDVSGWDAKLGILYQFNRMSRFGLTIQFPKTFSIKESFTVNGYSQFASQRYDLNQQDYSYNDVRYDIVTPFEIGAGFSFNIMGLILSAQGTLVDYSQLKFENPDGIAEVDIADLNKAIKNDLTAVVNYNFGAEYTIPAVGLRLRAGYFAQPSAYKGDPVSFDKKYITAGIGFLAEETIGLDLAFAHGWYSDIGDNYSSNLSRTNQKINENHFILTGTYRF
jgi:hypothetical protein